MTKVNDKYMISESVRAMARALKMPTFTEYEEIVRKLGPDEGYDVFLCRLMERELESRDEKGKAVRIKRAGFPVLKTLEELECDRFENIEEAKLKQLSSCDFIRRKENIVLVGNPGTGKTHISIGLGIRACQKGFTVKFVSASSLVYALTEARDQKELMRYTAQLQRVDLLIIDEFGYLHLNNEQADLFFKVISDRTERGSIILSTNLSFKEWTTIFGDERMVTALVGRLLFKSHALNVNSERPYRDDYAAKAG